MAPDPELPMNRPPDEDENVMPFLEHLEELRKVIIHSLVAVGIGAVIAWSVTNRVLTWLIAHTTGHAIFTRPEGAFMARFKVSVVIGVLIVLPYVFYRIWNFVGPGLLAKEKKIVFPGVVASVTLFYCGLVFSFLVMTPLMVRVLVGFGTPNLAPQTEVQFLLDFVFMGGLASGLIFQLPLFVGFLTWIGLLTPALLFKYWRHSIVGIFIVAAILTPADPISQLVLAAPLLVLYVLSLILASMLYKAKQRRRAAREAEQETEQAPEP
jgi:sec-independent protein translocase protein TatC